MLNLDMSIRWSRKSDDLLLNFIAEMEEMAV